MVKGNGEKGRYVVCADVGEIGRCVCMTCDV
jgi:hypothetical protein